ncbi:hypothetical protein BT69DRAFT_1158697 [Atractiella rhizophila]|nr:hypothetical protein BT69DRAFT_1158697 [Atractiella rhizophila]
MSEISEKLDIKSRRRSVLIAGAEKVMGLVNNTLFEESLCAESFRHCSNIDWLALSVISADLIGIRPLIINSSNQFEISIDQWNQLVSHRPIWVLQARAIFLMHSSFEGGHSFGPQPAGAGISSLII